MNQQTEQRVSEMLGTAPMPQSGTWADLLLLRNREIESAKALYPKLYEKFAKGNLFQSQRENLEAWTNAASRGTDLADWDHFDATAWMAGIECRDYSKYDHSYEEVRNFACLRIFPSTGERRRLAEGEGFSASWARVNQQRGWAGWMSNSGWQ